MPIEDLKDQVVLIAGAFIYLASRQRSGYATGQIIEVNGGQIVP